MSLALLTASSPSDVSPETLDAAWASAGGNVNLAALALWLQLESRMMTEPVKWQAQNDYSQDNTANLAAVRDRVRELKALVGLSPQTTGQVDHRLGTMSVGHMVNSRRMRRGQRGRRHLTSSSLATAASSSPDLSAIQAQLDAISSAIALTIPIRRVFTDYSIDAGVPLLIDVSSVFSTIDNIEVWQGSQQITEAVTSSHDFPNVTISSATPLTDIDVYVTGLPASA